MRPALALCLVLAAGAAMAQGSPRPATLTVTGDLSCTYPDFSDHQLSTDSYKLSLPEEGPVSARGSYTSAGNGYSIAGSSEISGAVKDRKLALGHRQWFYRGKGVMNGPSPFVPSAANPVVIPLAPGGTAVVSHKGAPFGPGITCSGSITYRIDF